MIDEFYEKIRYHPADNGTDILPADFPSSPSLGAVSGAQPKIIATNYQGRYYNSGCTPPELVARWKICEDLACQITKKSLESKAGKRAHMVEVKILEQYLPRLIAARWTSESEAKWVIRRTAQLLGWEVPQSAK